MARAHAALHLRMLLDALNAANAAANAEVAAEAVAAVRAAARARREAAAAMAAAGGGGDDDDSGTADGDGADPLFVLPHETRAARWAAALGRVERRNVLRRGGAVPRGGSGGGGLALLPTLPAQRMQPLHVLAPTAGGAGRSAPL